MHKWQCTITKALLSYLKISQEARKYSISNHIMFLCFEIKYNLSHNVEYSYFKRKLDILDIGTLISNWLTRNVILSRVVPFSKCYTIKQILVRQDITQ